jgi:hypothetical protein
MFIYFLHSCSSSIQIILPHLSTVITIEGYTVTVYLTNLSVPQNIALNVKTTVNKEFERMYKEAVVAFCKVILAICLEKLIK